MSRRTDAGRFRLARGSTLKLTAHARPSVIVCRAGTVWLTQQGDAADHVLESGESFLIDRPGLVVLQALADTEIDVARGSTV